MFKVQPIASGSSGNAILIDDGYGKALLDAGLSHPKLSREIRLTDIEAVLVTHEHGDHFKAVPELLRRGIPVYMSKGTAESKDIKPSRYHRVASERLTITDSFRIMPFAVNHDAAEPLGFLVESKNTGAKALYIVDSSVVDYDFSGVTHFIIECNYATDILEESNYDEWLKKRVADSHMSLDNLLVFLKTTDLSKADEIWLCHLSDANSHERRFIAEVQAATGVPVYAA